MSSIDSRVALIVVDVQNDFADAGGSLHVQGGKLVVEPIDALVTEAIEAGAMVVYTQDWHPASTPHFQKDGGVWPVHCVRDTWGAEFHPALRIRGEVVRKGSNGEDGYSGFHMRDPESGAIVATPLAGLLRARAIERVIVCGLATDYCVGATALDACAAGLATAVRLDLVRSVDLAPGDGDRMIARMAAAGATFES